MTIPAAPETPSVPRDDSVIVQAVTKVPAITLVFWILKIFATTLGEIGGDSLSMGGDAEDASSTGLGYLASTAILAAPFVVAVLVQILAKKFHPVIYWITIVATTLLGTTFADFSTRSLGIGYPGGTAILVVLLLASLGAWRMTQGSVSVTTVSTPRVEVFYWVTIMFSQTLGTALGDWASDSLDLGYAGASLIFGGLLAVIAAAYFWTSISHAALFWSAFVLTRPLGAVVGDLLDKPHAEGGLALSRYAASGVLVVLIAMGIFLFKHRAVEGAGTESH